MNLYILSWQFILIFITMSSAVKEELHLEGSAEYNCGEVDLNTLTEEGSAITSTSEVPWTAMMTGRDRFLVDKTFATLIISPSLILSSANYFVEDGQYRFFESYIVSVGATELKDHGIKDYFLTSGTPHLQTANITHITIHPNFNLSKSWATRKNHIALVHLANPLVLSEDVHPICLPGTSDLQELVESPGDESLIVSGWNRNVLSHPIFLRLSVLPQGRCKDIYEAQEETGGAAYENTTCALVGKKNGHDSCVHRDVAAARLINGSYYFAGIVSEVYSLNDSKICYPDSLYYLTEYSTKTHAWIANSIRCGPDNFTCHNGDCTSATNVCNQESDCSDGSDEDPEFCRGRNFCRQGQFLCGIYGPCIEDHKVQDGFPDCPNGEDEMEPEQRKNYTGFIAGGSVVGFLVIAVLLILSLCIFVLKNRIRDLTKEEMEIFIHGFNLSESTKEFYEKGGHNSDVVYIGNYDPVQCMAWNNEYEIPFKQLEIMDEINRGNSGIVYKARRLSCGSFGNQSEVVAVKTNISTIKVDKFKALLCELKIIAHVGSHDHIVTFIGACTEHIKTRNVYMVVEYCPEGDLLNHLIKIRNSTSVDMTSSRMVITGYVSAKPAKRKIIDLIKWTYQIACGMDYLTSRMVVHGDLAARNVLLSANLDAKITDFGLSRKLDTSKIYVKTSHEEVPWKWLAPESLQQPRSFSEKSDVWSFGVLVWEIFTFGQKPYGNKDSGHGFVDSLLQGMRLLQPTYATDEIYEIMRSCWKVSPQYRPSFKSLKESFSEILERANRS